MIKLPYRLLVLSICCLLLAVPAIAQEDETFTGPLSDAEQDFTTSYSLQPGQTISVSAVATSGNLDTYIILMDNNNNTIVENDDRAPGNLDALVTFTAPEAVVVTVIVNNIGGTAGDYEVQITFPDAPPAAAQSAPAATEATYLSFMSDITPEATYEVQVPAGRGLVATAEATSGDLDTFIYIEDENGRQVAINDDRGLNDLNSQAVYITPEDGVFTVFMTNISGTSGEYKLEIAVTSAEAAEARSRVRLSGPREVIDTEHFRIHYTLEGVDATTVEYAQAVAQTMEEIYAIQIDLLGWPIPPQDDLRGGDGRYDVYLADILNNFDGGDLGFASPEFPTGDNPFTELVEDVAVPSFLVLDNDYAIDAQGQGDPLDVMQATAAHEFHHGIQFGYDQNDSHNWYYEATSSWMETVTKPEVEEASVYAANIFSYPEICFGAQDAADPTENSLMYGHWLFIQTLADTHGDTIINQLWDNIALLDGFAALEATLTPVNDTIPDAVARYHVNNLVRDYRLAPDFGGVTVWEENRISDLGSWSYTGQGIQELAANYFTLTVAPGAYDVRIVESPNLNLQLWMVGIRGDVAEVIALGVGGTINTGPYDAAHLMVFNPSFDNDIDACDYTSYSLEVSAGTGTPPPPRFTLDATNYLPITR